MARVFCFVLLFGLIPRLQASPGASWSGVVRDLAGNPVGMAKVMLVSADRSGEYSASTSANGQFVFAAVAAGSYALTVSAEGKTWAATEAIVFKDGAALTFGLQLTPQGQELRVVVTQGASNAQASGGEHLSTGEVSSLPLNERDFSKLLLLAAGTMTDTNGAANFTQQFAVNGQRTLGTARRVSPTWLRSLGATLFTGACLNLCATRHLMRGISLTTKVI
jgi:hypothetical protein